MYHVSAQGVDERMINVHYYYNIIMVDDFAYQGFKVFKVLLSFWPLGARKRSYIRTRHSL